MSLLCLWVLHAQGLRMRGGSVFALTNFRLFISVFPLTSVHTIRVMHQVFAS